MDALDIISLEQAKNWLGGIEFTDDDLSIERLIGSAIDWVEKYTCYRLYQRTETIITSMAISTIYAYPFSITSVKNTAGADIPYKLLQISPLKYRFSTFTSCLPGTEVTIIAQTGFDDVTKVPGSLIEAAYKILTYLYENRDIYEFKLPSDIQFLINPYRRALI